VRGGRESAVSSVVLVHGHKRALDRGRFPLLETLALGLRQTWRELMRTRIGSVSATASTCLSRPSALARNSGLKPPAAALACTAPCNPPTTPSLQPPNHFTPLQPVAAGFRKALHGGSLQRALQCLGVDGQQQSNRKRAKFLGHGTCSIDVT
jgi:hypothetical protein